MVNTQNILVSKKWFDSLSASEQAAIKKAGQEATVWRANQLSSEVKIAWEAFEKRGVDIIWQADLDMDAFAIAGQSVIDEYVGKGYFTEAYLDMVKGLGK